MVIKYPVKGADGHEGSVKRSLARSLAPSFLFNHLNGFLPFFSFYFVQKNRSPFFLLLLLLFLLLFVSSRDSISNSNEREREIAK